MSAGEDHIVVDVEIQKTIEETPGGWDATDKLGVSCAVVYEFKEDRFRVYGPDQIEELRERLSRADRISGYNIWKFDLPVIWGLPQPERVTDFLPKVNDLLRRIWQGKGLDPDIWTDQHRGYTLDAMTMGTLGRQKIATGDKAPRWFQAGQWARLVNYCLDDVTLERDLVVFADRHRFLVHGFERRLVYL